MGKFCILFRSLCVSLLIGLLTLPNDSLAANDEAMIAQQSRKLIYGTRADFSKALQAFRERGKPDVAAVLILALRFSPRSKHEISAVLQEITGHKGKNWFDWMIWQQKHPDIHPHRTYTAFET